MASKNYSERTLDKNNSERRVEAAPTLGLSLFRFRKSFPSKWDDAEKWLISTSSYDSPAHVIKPSEQPRPTRPSVHRNVEKPEISSEILLKEKFTDNVDTPFTNFQYSPPVNERFVFSKTYCEAMKDSATEVHRKDMGTEMTPLASLTTTRCHTPVKDDSPVRHNTPSNLSGFLASPNIDVSELRDSHFGKLRLSAQYDPLFINWSTREEEAELSKSLRRSEMVSVKKGVTESKAASWEGEEKAKRCIRYQREEAKIQAWMNLEKAKAEAQSRKLELKIEKMRSNLEGKLMKRMTGIERKAEEQRGAAKLQHSQQMVKASEQAQKMRIQQPQLSCSCFASNDNQLKKSNI